MSDTPMTDALPKFVTTEGGCYRAEGEHADHVDIADCEEIERALGGNIAQLKRDLAAANADRNAWRGAAYRVGESIGPIGPNGYYLYTAQQWADWAQQALAAATNARVEQNEKDAERYLNRYRHLFKTPQWSDADPFAETCAECGMNLRDPIHRAAIAAKEKP